MRRHRCSSARIARPGCRPFAQGKTKLTLLNTEPCNRCDGNGFDWGVGPEKCRKCGGTGRTCVRCKAKGKLVGPSGGWIECDICDGYGWGEPLRAIPVETPGSEVWLVKGGKPHLVQKRLASVLKTLRGDVCVCEPYFGPGVLNALVAMKYCDSFRCLTRELGNGGKPVAEEQIKIFRKDHPAAEFRVSNSGDLRDQGPPANSEASRSQVKKSPRAANLSCQIVPARSGTSPHAPLSPEPPWSVRPWGTAN